MDVLEHDPLIPLLDSGNRAIIWQVDRYILDRSSCPAEELWELREPKRLMRRQGPDGRWRYPATDGRIRSRDDYDQLQTYKTLLDLIHKYRMDRRDIAISRAAEFLFSFQRKEGDLRGLYANQYTPNYTAAIMEVLICAGYGDDPRIQRGFDWLLSIRQEDGGWAIPFRTRGRDLSVSFEEESPTLDGDRSRPFSHLITGIVLRAFASHPLRRSEPGVIEAGEMLASRMFNRDAYPDRADPIYWEKIQFPYQWTDVLSVLDTLSLLGFAPDHPDVARGIDWLIDDQGKDGLWRSRYGGKNRLEKDLWVTLAVSRVLRRLLG